MARAVSRGSTGISLSDIGEFFAAEVLGSLLPGPEGPVGRTLFALFLSVASFGVGAFCTHSLITSGEPYVEPDWAFEFLVTAAVMGIVGFSFGVAYTHNEENRSLASILAVLLGLAAILVFPITMLVI